MKLKIEKRKKAKVNKRKGKSYSLQNGLLCPGPATEERPCDKGPCPHWSPWGQWEKCSKECGAGHTVFIVYEFDTLKNNIFSTVPVNA